MVYCYAATGSEEAEVVEGEHEVPVGRCVSMLCGRRRRGLLLAMMITRDAASSILRSLAKHLHKFKHNVPVHIIRPLASEDANRCNNDHRNREAENRHESP